MADNEDKFEDNIDEHDDFSGGFADDDLSGIDLFDEEEDHSKHSDEKHTEEEYQFEQDGQDLAFQEENFQFTDEEDAEMGTDTYETPAAKTPGFVQRIINKYKHEDPKKLALFAGGGIFAFILLITMLTKLVGDDQQKTSVSTLPGKTSTNKTADIKTQQGQVTSTKKTQSGQVANTAQTQQPAYSTTPLTTPAETQSTDAHDISADQIKGFQEHVKLRFNQTKDVLEEMQDENKNIRKPICPKHTNH